MGKLSSRKFDCVLITNLLHLQPEPEKLLTECVHRVGEGGTLLLAGPNFNRIPILVKRTLDINGYRKLRSYAEGGINAFGPLTLAERIRNLGLEPSPVQWLNHEFSLGQLGRIQLSLGGLTARDWILQARRPVPNHRSN